MSDAAAPERERTLVEDHPGLLVLAGASHPAMCLSFAIPLACGLGFVGYRPGLPLWVGAVELAIGVVYWTFVEYAMHRWFYHWRPSVRPLRRFVESFHVYHHRNIPDRRVYNAGPLLALPLAFVLIQPILLVTQDFARSCTVLLGTVSAYYDYEWFHYSIHVVPSPRGWLGAMARFHLHHHHRNWRTNFGVTNPLWDMLMGTAVRAAQPGRDLRKTVVITPRRRRVSITPTVMHSETSR
jgi:sterol desaturase/sphingolipid hydroxylase (fatty acid hydroxylase superfamily)